MSASGSPTVNVAPSPTADVTATVPPWAFAIAATMAGLPPAYLVISEFDPLRDEDLAYAAKLEAAGVPVTVRRFDDQIHAFFVMVNLMESANTAVAEAGAAIRAATGQASAQY